MDGARAWIIAYCTAALWFAVMLDARERQCKQYTPIILTAVMAASWPLTAMVGFGLAAFIDEPYRCREKSA